MKIVVIGGSGLVGSKLVSMLNSQCHEVLAAFPGVGIDARTGEGLAEALEGAQVVVDVTNSPSFEDTAVMNFFRISSGNLLKEEARAGVGHHVALSIVGADRVPDSGYLRAKMAQEKLIEASGVPYSILRSTQFFEFIGRIADAGEDGNHVRVSNAFFQPVLSNDVAAALVDIALGAPLNGIAEVAGPERFRMHELVGRVLRAAGDSRDIVADPRIPYFGGQLDDRSLVPGPDARIGAKRFLDWLAESAARDVVEKPAAASMKTR